MFVSDRFAREHLVEIVRGRVALVPEEARRVGLRLVELALDQWKRSRARRDGTVDIKNLPMGGLLSPLPVPLADIGQVVAVPVKRLTPEQCAQLPSAADLLFKLISEKDPSVADLPDRLRGSLGVALLVERDAHKLPMDVLAFHVRMIWIDVNERLGAYSNALLRVSKERAAAADTLADKRVKAKLEKQRKARAREEGVFVMGVDYFAAYPDKENDDAAHYIHKQIQTNHTRDLIGLSLRGIKDRLGGAKKEAQRRGRQDPDPGF